MALNIKNPQVEKLAEEVARLANETKTEAIRKALIERRTRLQVTIGRPGRKTRLVDFLRRSVWPHVPAEVIGRRWTQEEEDAVLGYGPEGH